MESILIYTFVFLVGLALGSFLNVVIYRIPAGEGIVIKPSHCMKCGKRIKFYDLIPVLSYIILRGKCRHCGDKFSIQYPLVELLTGLLLVGIYHWFGWAAPVHTLAIMVLTAMFIAVFFIDLKHYIIPNEIIVFGLVSGLIFAGLKGINFANPVIYDWNFLKDAGLGFVVGLLTFLLIVVVGEWLMKAEAMGMGDVKLMGVVGLFLGLKLTVLSMMLAFIVGSVVSIFLLATRIKGRKDQIPFGPFIVMGSMAAAFWGNDILSWYFSLGRF